jgi:hypothetical protein
MHEPTCIHVYDMNLCMSLVPTYLGRYIEALSMLPKVQTNELQLYRKRHALRIHDDKKLFSKLKPYLLDSLF